MENFTSYFKEIDKKTSEIPENNLLFWGSWFCEGLYQRCKNQIQVFLTDEEVLLINEIISYLWNLVDEKEQIDMSKINLLYEKLNDIDETDLDETDYQQKEIYELIVSLDEVLSYCQSGERGFEFSISQSIINVIDIMLQDEDKDILSKEGFQDALVQNEIKAQFEMISLLKEKKLTSEFKHWLRK
ncbi:hypothetical protein JMN11_06310 [Capnocytophaga genosp. AHN8471]|uniref:hypothetical protein n=1 Tax=Capnocytophaga genosp. AHN8471 TaxID=327574 RepID=UPI001931F552|nr:hypothetical protein [Capnocytophaga genosp. AHN8471]MBM0653284.1 hypothetical protein [Capnocytophaga genosp. AHN8471]